MKSLDKLINKVGNDKVLHFLVGAIITMMGYPFGLLGVVIGLFVVLVLSALKEYVFDDEADIMDIVAGLCGSVCAVLYYLACRLVIT